MNFAAFSLRRTLAIFIKEFQQMMRDRLTFSMAVGAPITQLVLFGYAINTDPKGLPTVLVATESGPLARSLTAALQNSGYFRITHMAASERDAEALVERGQAQFMIVVPPDFDARVVRGERPALLVSVGTPPTRRRRATRSRRWPREAPFEVRLHRRYNPEGLSRYNIVRGTMENLLATPVRPLEVMVGKIAPYVVIGYIQLGVILGAAFALFQVPMVGSFALLMSMIGVFMLANLAVGFTFSTLARNQLQAMQMTFFFFVPSILMSGFMFPFRGMPEWAQAIGEGLPLTHFLRIVRCIMLKGNGAAQLWPELWPMLVFLLAAGNLGIDALSAHGRLMCKRRWRPTCHHP